jgi:hypothetical protein
MILRLTMQVEISSKLVEVSIPAGLWARDHPLLATDSHMPVQMSSEMLVRLTNGTKAIRRHTIELHGLEL